MKFSVESLTPGVENEVKGANVNQLGVFLSCLLADKLTRPGRPSLVVRLGSDRYMIKGHEEGA